MKLVNVQEKPKDDNIVYHGEIPALDVKGLVADHTYYQLLLPIILNMNEDAFY